MPFEDGFGRQVVDRFQADVSLRVLQVDGKDLRAVALLRRGLPSLLVGHEVAHGNAEEGA